VVAGVFLAGWARKASEGLVGIAKRDGDWCAEVITRYLGTQPPRSRGTIEGVLAKLQTALKERKSRPVDLEGLKVLDAAEKAHAASPEAIGDYTAGPSHTMPTGGSARWSSPLTVHVFCLINY
jgi:ferredoxin--NADP+ reductase